jgi:hypothetical protein
MQPGNSPTPDLGAGSNHLPPPRRSSPVRQGAATTDRKPVSGPFATAGRGASPRGLEALAPFTAHRSGDRGMVGVRRKEQ